MAVRPGVPLVGRYALVRTPGGSGLGLVLIAGHDFIGGGLIALVITFRERDEEDRRSERWGVDLGAFAGPARHATG